MKRGEGTTAAINAAKSNEQGSLKWISVAQNRSRIELTVNPDVNSQVFRPTGKSKCNLISVFGAARQGKSFLMNCLAGQTEVFQISNQRESCTQGIDISQRLLPLSTFASIHGDRAHTTLATSATGKINIGFVDAEGQGDRDVTYDANLICPVLLVSKCVIFNWKDSMQKDKILNQLGILHKAAINVACEDESLIDDSDQKLFGHLHLVFRDWQYEGSDEKSVFNDIFKEERSAETAAAVRNQIRRSVKENFESITVWLFPPPVKDSAQLSTKLSYDVTQESFKQQLSDLRGKLSSQLATPSVFDGKALCGNTLGSIVQTIATVLNTGDAVRPKPAWVSMICSEIEQSRIAFEKTLRQECDKVIETFEKKCTCAMTSASTASRRLSTGDVKRESRGVATAASRGSSSNNSRNSLNIPSRSEPAAANGLVSSSFPRWDQAERSLRGTIQSLYEDYKAGVDAITGDSSSSGTSSRPSTLSPEDYEAIESALQRSIDAEKAHFTGRFAQLCGRWARAAKETCMGILDSECNELQRHTPFEDEELSAAMDEFFTEVSHILQERLAATTQYASEAEEAARRTSLTAKTKGSATTMNMYILSDFKLAGSEADKKDIEETLRNLRQAADLQFQVVSHVNDESKRKAEAACRDCLSDAQRRLEVNVDRVARDLLSAPSGVSKAALMTSLDQQFKEINDALWESVTALPLGHGFVDSYQKELEETGLTLVKKIESSYADACRRFVKNVVTEASKTVTMQSEPLLERGDPVSEEELQHIYQGIVDKVGDAASRAVSQWTMTGDERNSYFEDPLRQLLGQRLQTLQMMNRKLLNMAAQEAALREQHAAMQHEYARKAEADAAAAATRAAEADSSGKGKSKKRSIAECGDNSSDVDMSSPEKTVTPIKALKSRRVTKQFLSAADEDQYDMDVVPNASDKRVSKPSASQGKSRRLTKQFKDAEDEGQYDMDVSGEEEEEEEEVAVARSSGASSSGRLPSGGTSKAEQQRKAKEWALARNKAKAVPKGKAAPKVKTPPIPESEDESEEEVDIAPVATKGRGKGRVAAGKALIPKKLTATELIQQAKEKARLAIEERQTSRLAELAVEIEEEERREAAAGGGGGRTSDAASKRRKSGRG